MSSSVPGAPQYTFITALGVQFQAIILYRILRNLPDIADEFDSYAKKGHAPRRPLVGAGIADWGATSLFDRLVDARNVAQNMRTAGRPVTEIAEVHLPTNGWFPLSQTGKNLHLELTRCRGHSKIGRSDVPRRYRHAQEQTALSPRVPRRSSPPRPQ